MNLCYSLTLMFAIVTTPICLLAASCTELTPGQTINLSGQRAGLMTAGAYQLERSAKNSQTYIARVRYEFIPAPDLQVDNWETIARDYRQQVEQCFVEASPFLRGPGGEQLTLELWDPRRSSLTAKIWRVEIGHHTTNYRRWFYDEFSGATAAVPCRVVIHETLHVLGLVDEYPLPKYQCRALGPADSIMRSAQYYQQLIQTPARPATDSLLKPAHFRQITRPWCRTQNQTYRHCASSAGVKAAEPSACPTISPLCRSVSWLN